MNTYRCNHCHHTVQRDDDRRWITSWCDTTQRTTRLWRTTTTSPATNTGTGSNHQPTTTPNPNR